jgi:hypothetical protein
MKNKLAPGCIVFLIAQTIFAQLSLRETIIDRIPPCQFVRSDGTARNRLWENLSEAPPVAPQAVLSIRSLTLHQEEGLVPPILLKKEALQAGNPLATYAAMLDLEPQYLKSKVFADFYREIRFNLEEFLGFPLAGVQAMSLPTYRRAKPSVEPPLPEFYRAENAISVIEREARKTRLVIWGEEHHLPQTRSLYEALLRMLWQQGYRYLAAETFADKLMNAEFKYPDYQSGFYLRDPVFAAAIRTARSLGYKLIAYETQERGPTGDGSFRDRKQAENIKARIFDHDPQAKVFIIAGRGHASEETALDGWTPMASVLKRLTGINPLTLYAPRMSQRLTSDEEDPFYRFATSHGLVKEPTIFVNRSEGRLLGSDRGDLDAYLFWPRIEVKDGRPDWMVKELRRKPIKIPRQLLNGSGMRLVQVFKEGEPASAIPIDQVIIDDQSDRKVLMLPKGKFWLRTVDRDSKVIDETTLGVS